MIEAKEHDKESERIQNLESYSILDTLPESDYDSLTTLASEICGTPISLVSLIDKKRQWFKSHHGLDATETPKEYAFCTHAINDPENIFIIQVARIDNRFHDNPLVTGDPYVIFYAGVPLISEEGYPLGTLCVIDHKPNLLSQSQIKSLTALSKQVMNLISLRRNKLFLEQSLKELEEKNQELERFAFIAAHDLKSPLIGISSLTNFFLEEYDSKIDEEGQKMLKLIIETSSKLRNLIDGLLDYSRGENVLKEDKSNINLETLKHEITGLFSYDHNLKLEIKSSLTEIYINKTAINQILINLVTNAIKYNDKDIVEIEIGISESDSQYIFYVQDNGPGIEINFQDKIFRIFEIVAAKDKFGQTGNGIGLATVKKIVEKSGGSINVQSELEKGAKFIFTIEK